MGRVKFLISAHIYVSVYHYVSAEQGSITHVLSEDAEILNNYSYDAFGNIIQKTEKVENRFCYNGEMLDPVTQQYYLRARFYNPVIGRFTQEDTYYGDGLNLYQYCQANPVGYVDPSGHNCGTTQSRYNSDEKQHPKANAAGGYQSAAEKGNSKSGTPSSKIDYKEVFFKEHPELRGEVWVHHGVEQQVLTKPQTKGLFSYEEMHSLDNLRGIPKEINSDLHLSKIRKEWNKFYKEFPNPTKEQLLQKRLDIDKKYGHLFKPLIDVE